MFNTVFPFNKSNDEYNNLLNQINELKTNQLEIIQKQNLNTTTLVNRLNEIDKSNKDVDHIMIVENHNLRSKISKLEDKLIEQEENAVMKNKISELEAIILNMEKESTSDKLEIKKYTNDFTELNLKNIKQENDLLELNIKLKQYDDIVYPEIIQNLKNNYEWLDQSFNYEGKHVDRKLYMYDVIHGKKLPNEYLVYDEIITTSVKNKYMNYSVHVVISNFGNLNIKLLNYEGNYATTNISISSRDKNIDTNKLNQIITIIEQSAYFVNEEKIHERSINQPRENGVHAKVNEISSCLGQLLNIILQPQIFNNIEVIPNCGY